MSFALLKAASSCLLPERQRSDSGSEEGGDGGGGEGGDVERREDNGCRQPAFISALIKPLFLSDLKSQLAETSETVCEFSPELLASGGRLEREGGGKVRGRRQRRRRGGGSEKWNGGREGVRVEAPRRGRDGFVRSCLHGITEMDARRSACRLRRNEAVEKKKGGQAAWLAAQCHRKSAEAVLKCATPARLAEAQQQNKV